MSARRKLGDRYLLEEPIGTGSMGTVFRALDERTGDTVAIKLLKSMDPADIQRFDREFTIVSELVHPAIVTCWGADRTEDGERYFVMEWLAGESLRERLRRTELSLEETLTLAGRLSEGLAIAHARGVVHRDVKPGNVFLEGEVAERAKLLDFGIARLVAAGETLTRTGEIVGTPGYVSPEQIQSQRVDQRSDVYSLGCLLFRCLTGRAVFEDERVLEMLVRVTRDRAPALRELRPDLPESLTSLVDRMLSREPIDRPADAGEVLRELEANVLSPRVDAGADAELRAAKPAKARRPTPEEPAASASAPEDTSTVTKSSAVDAPLPVSLPGARLKGRIVAVVGTLAAAIVLGIAIYFQAPTLFRDVPPPAVVTSASAPFGSPDERIGADAQAAWAEIRLGARRAAVRRLDARVRSGAASASERLWLSLLSGPGEEGKRHHREATVRSNDLTSFERAALEAASPMFAAPADLPAADRAIDTLASAAQSAELAFVLARLRTQMNDKERALAAIDPWIGSPWSIAARVERLYVDWEFFDVEGGRADALACTKERRDAVDCIAFLGRRAALDGDCSAMEGHARDWVHNDPDDPAAYELLAHSLAARGERPEALREALEQKWARLAEHELSAAKNFDSIMLTSLQGDLTKASAQALEATQALPADAPLRQRLEGSFLAALVATEMDDRRLVGDIAARVLEGANAATPSTPGDAAYFLLFVGVSRGFAPPDPRWDKLGDEAFARYESYVATQGEYLRPYQRILPWVLGYGAGATTDELVRRAYEALPRYGPPPPPGGRADDIELVIGKVLAHSGEEARGTEYLRRAARSCLVLANPYAVLRARLELGKVAERRGDREEAKAAYEGVLTHWEDAKPRSRTAEVARDGLARLRRAAD